MSNVITIKSTSSDKENYIFTDADLSYKDTYLVQGYTLGRGVESIELLKG